MRTAFITLSREGATLLGRVRKALPDLDAFVHESAGPVDGATPFAHIQALTEDLFPNYQAMIYAAPCGVVVRSIAGCVRSKLTDPAVVVLDAGARWCVSLLSGHEGGANALAMEVANALGAEPVITTTTEAVKDVIAGVGCRRGTPCEAIVAAVQATLERASVTLARVRMMASADVKADEPGLRQAARELNLPLRLIPSAEIRASARGFEHSAFVASKVGVPAVAEPSALLAGRRTELFQPKMKYPGVTVALARECFTSSGSVPDIR
jgi:cobalt-precorrin 5A hydrolase